MFRDETTITAQRANKKQSKSPSPILDDYWDELRDNSPFEERLHPYFGVIDGKTPVRALLDGSYEFDFNQVARSSSPTWYLDLDRIPSPNPALTWNVQERAKAHFFNQWAVFGNQHAFHLYDIQSQLYSRADVNDPIRATTDAIAMLTLSKQPGEQRVRQEAARAYSTAIRQVAGAVADPARMKEDQTLLSVILLGFAETIDITAASHPGFMPRYAGNPKDSQAIKFHHAWGAHAGGAERIAKARGLEDMTKSLNSMKLAGFVRMQTLHKQLFVAHPMDDVDDLWGPIGDFKGRIGSWSGHIELADIAIKLPSLRSRGLIACRKPMAPGVGAELMQVLADVRAVDAELEAWSAMMTTRKQYGIAGYYTEPLAEDVSLQRVWPGAVMNFDSLMVMNATNLYRTYRLFMGMLIFNILERLIEPSELQTHPEFTSCTKTIRNVVDEICGTVPYGTGSLQHIPLSPSPSSSALGTFVNPNLIPDLVRRVEELEPSTPSWSSTPTGWSLDDDVETGAAIGAWYMTWPCYIAYSVPPIPREQKDWLRGRLRHIGLKYGIAQAVMYQNGDKDVYVPGKRRRFMPLDFAPPPWEPLQ